MNVLSNPYKRDDIDYLDNQTEYFTAENKAPDFSSFFQVPTDAKESINLTDGGSIKSVISEIINMGLKSESTVTNYRKA